MLDKFKKKIKKFLLNDNFAKEDSEFKFRVIRFNIIINVSSFILIVTSVVNLIISNYFIAFIEFSALFLLIFICILFNKRKITLNIASFMGILFVFIMLIYLVLNHDMVNGFQYWLFLFPIVTLYLTGIVFGSILNLIYYIIAFILISEFNDTFNQLYLGRFFANYFLVFAFFFVSEYIRLRFQKNLEDQNQELVKTIEKYDSAQNKIIDLEKKNSVLAMIVTTNHDLNQPLTALNGNLELFISSFDKENLNEKQLKFLKNMKSSYRKVNSILKKYRETESISFGKYHGDTNMVIIDNKNIVDQINDSEKIK